MTMCKQTRIGTKSSVKLNDYELVNKTRHEITIFNEDKEEIANIEEADKPCEVVYESQKVEEMEIENDSVGMFARTDKKTKNLPPRPEKGEPINTLYIVSFVVREANPDRIDFISPTNYVRDDEARVVGCRNFNVHPELARDPKSREEYPRWVECPNCGGFTAKNGWTKHDFQIRERRFITQLAEYTMSGSRKHLTVQMPSINTEVDLFIKDGELKIMETGLGDEEELKASEMEA